jgi:MYXO-CTERM domain-containing protein
MLNKSARVLILALGLGCVLAGAARADDWASLGLDGTRARLSAERSGGTFGPARWEHSLPPIKDLVYRALMASPAVADGYLVYGTTGYLVQALREQDGAEVWQFATKNSVFSSPALWRGRAYVVDTGRQLYALRLADGALVWKRDLDGIAYASPTVVDGSVLVATGDPNPRIVRFDAETGAVIWRAGAELLQQAVYASVTVAEGHVIVGEAKGHYHSFAFATGAHEWTAETGGLVHMSSPLVLNGRVYLVPAGESTQMHALEIDSGKAVSGWPVELPAVPAPDAPLLGRQYTVSSLAGQGAQIVFARRVEDRLDRDHDGVTDSIALEESVLAIDAHEGRLLWSKPNGRVVTADPNQVPSYGYCPTPALYASVAGETLVAVASTLSPQLRVLALATGDERWSAEVSGPTRGSPVLANGRLVVGTDAGVIHSFLSRTNQPPQVAGGVWSPAGGQDVDASAVSLRWGLALDPEGESVRYQVRLDDDGELLHDWDLEVMTAPGQRSLDVSAQLVPGRIYTYAVRARDSQGAFSSWSPARQFKAVMTPSVQLDGTPATSLSAALAMAHAGSVITLGAGVFPLSDTLRLPAGVSLAGAAPHLTTLSGKGLAVAVQAGSGNKLSQLTVTGAAIGVEVTSGEDAHLQNVILRDNEQAGLSVSTGAGASLVSATIARNGSGVRAAGKLEIRNAIVTANDVGIDATEAPLVQSHYNDVFANRTADYQKAQRGQADRSVPVVFGKGDADLRLMTVQPTTDQGDPADEYLNEPEPNGARINLGAFGNTAFAELSDLSLLPPPPPAPGAQPKSGGGGLCSMGADGRPDGALVLVALALFWGRRRRR